MSGGFSEDGWSFDWAWWKDEFGAELDGATCFSGVFEDKITSIKLSIFLFTKQT